jgi:predicted Fe-Mo cluster-binding NifX family protein
LEVKKFRIAVATNGKDGLEDAVSQVFGRANTFTIIDIEDGEIGEVKIIENPAASYQHGVGPLVVKKLADSKVNVVIAPEFGPGASTLLKQHQITMISAKPDTIVKNTIEDALKKVEAK